MQYHVTATNRATGANSTLNLECESIPDALDKVDAAGYWVKDIRPVKLSEISSASQLINLDGSVSKPSSSGSSFWGSIRPWQWAVGLTVLIAIILSTATVVIVMHVNGSDQPMQSAASMNAKRLQTQNDNLLSVPPQTATNPLNTPQVIHPSAPPPSAIPADVSFSVVTTNEVSGNGVRLEIRINKIVSQEVLRAVASALKAAETHPYQRTLMLFYLPDMTPGHGAWANAYFDPDLKVEILGFTAEQTARNAEQAPSNQETIGQWVDNFPGSSCKITIYRANGNLLTDRRFQDGSGGVNTLIEKSSPLGRRFEDIRGSDSGDNWVITPEGDLQIRDDTGLLDTAKSVK